MNSKSLIGGVLVLSLCLSNAGATVIVNENFDSYANQTAFQTAWAAIGTVAPTSGLLSTEQAVSGTQSIKVEGTATSGQERNRLTFAESGFLSSLNQITFSFDFYDSSSAAQPYRQYMNLQDTTAPGSTGQLISLGMNNNQTSANSGGNYFMARILGYTPTLVDPDGGPNEDGTLATGTYFKLNDFAAGLRTTGWHNLKVILSSDDGLSTDFAFYVDNVLAERVSNVGTAASFRSYDNIALGSGVSNASNPAYYDNVFLDISAVPEPGTFSLAVLGLGALVMMRRFRK